MESDNASSNSLSGSENVVWSTTSSGSGFGAGSMLAKFPPCSVIGAVFDP